MYVFMYMVCETWCLMSSAFDIIRSGTVRYDVGDYMYDDTPSLSF